MPPKIVTHLTRIACFGMMGWNIAVPVQASSVAVDTDIPEEVLRAEIITEARSPIDGKALSAIEFAELVVTAKQQLERDDASLVTDNPKVKETLFLLRLRSFLRSVGVPIK
ncbi:hypothetical protein [Chamaesiphon sp.]|uniref:hypothetical protein n=1 Tax=Chamaesiphon sp. TaxID=2814140 RepID=UPI0035940E78